MAEIDIPRNPAIGQEFTVAGITRRWTGEYWEIITSRTEDVGLAFAGYFEDGFTYTAINQYGVAQNGDLYLYKGTLNHVVPAGTDPASNTAIYKKWSNNDFQGLDNLTAISDLNLVTPRVRTLSEAVAENAPVDTLYTISDRGGANFKVQPVGLVANGLDIVALAAGTSLEYQRDSEPVNVKHFGAVGNGIVDDTAAIQRALGQRGEVYVPKGTYIITDTIQVFSNTQLRGSGHATVFKWVGAASTRGYMLDCSDGVVGDDAVVGIYVRDIAIDMSSTTNQNGILWRYSSSQGFLENIFLDHLGDNAHGFKIGKTWYASFRNLTVRSSTGVGTIGFLITDDIHQVNAIPFENFQVHSCDVGVRLESVTTGHYDLIFYNLLVEACRIGISANGGFSVRQCMFIGAYFEVNTEWDIFWDTPTTTSEKDKVISLNNCTFVAGNSNVRVGDGSWSFEKCNGLTNLTISPEVPSVAFTGDFISGTITNNGNVPFKYELTVGEYDIAQRHANQWAKPVGGMSLSANLAGSGTDTFDITDGLSDVAQTAGDMHKLIITQTRSYTLGIIGYKEFIVTRRADGGGFDGFWLTEVSTNGGGLSSVTIDNAGVVTVTSGVADASLYSALLIPIS